MGRLYLYSLRVCDLHHIRTGPKLLEMLHLTCAGFLAQANFWTTPMPRRGPDLTNRERQARHRGRRKAILMALSAPVGTGPAKGPDASSAPADPDRLDPQDVKSAIRKLAKLDRLA